VLRETFVGPSVLFAPAVLASPVSESSTRWETLMNKKAHLFVAWIAGAICVATMPVHAGDENPDVIVEWNQ